MSEGKGQIILAHRPSTNTMGINGKSCCPVGNVTSASNSCVSQALKQEKLCQSYDMLKYLNLTQEESAVENDSCGVGDVYLPWRRLEPSDVQLDFHRAYTISRFNSPVPETITGNPFCSIGRSGMTTDSDHDSMKCLNTCCYRLPTLPEGVSVCEAELVTAATNASPVSRVPSTSDVVSTDVIPPPWKTIETEPPEPASAGQHGATLSSLTQSEQNSGPLYITDSTCHCTWTGTGAAHYRGSRRNSLVPTATGSSRRRCSQAVTSVERVSIFDGDDDEALMIQGRAERSWSWLLDCPMTVEEDEGRTRRNSIYDAESVVSQTADFTRHAEKWNIGGGIPAAAGADSAGAGSCVLSDFCLLPTAMQLLLARSHSACELNRPVDDQLSSWPHGTQLRKSASVPNLAFI